MNLEFASHTSEIPLSNIKFAGIRSGQVWHTVLLRHSDGEAVVSGLPPDSARSCIEALETVRGDWWRRTLEPQIDTLCSVHDEIMRLADSPTYLARSAFAELRHKAQDVAGQFTGYWPDALSDSPEIQMLKMIRGFLKNSESFRAKANDAFVVNELRRSRALFDHIDKRPLTEEQRKIVVIDDDRNLVIAAAGSGKTSLIVTKASWLIQRTGKRPSELLLLAFARDACEEMKERIRAQLANDLANGITVSTFHSLGLAIIGAVEGQRPAISKVAEDAQALHRLLKEIVTDLVAEQEISEAVLTWFKEQFVPYQSMHEFKTWGAYYDYIRRHEIRSLKGDQVKSFEECEIANFLYLNGIEYEYERLYEHETSTSGKGPYRPDFFLPGSGIWIEHFGINAEGKTAPFVPQAEYLESMAWKKELHKSNNTILIETFSHECAAGTLLRNLEDKLCALGVTMSPISTAEAFAALEDQGWIDPFIRLVATFLQHFKGAQLSYEQVLQNATSVKDRARAEIFFSVFRRILERYQDKLRQSGEIDFNDMIAKATEHVEAGRYRSPFRYVLIDEFQDISSSRARLLKALIDSSPGTKLFAVGDDWQAIFRFAGSDIGIMREFRNHFGEGEQLFLETTFRCADGISTVATQFILRNPSQISKTVRSIHQANAPCVHVGLRGEQKLSLLKEALDRVAEDAISYSGTSTVLLLGRYNHMRPQNMSDLARQYPGLNFTYKTVHGSKGLEADYVVVLGLCAAKYGFPSEIADDPLLDLVLAAPERHPNAEERRLLYVAITRARRHAFLLADDPPSSFVTELAEFGNDVTVFGRLPERDYSCPVCVNGRLLRRENSKNRSIFYGCSNYPYCEYRHRSCPKCREGLIVKTNGKFKCRDCGQSIEACPKCDGWLEIKMGKYGRFLGCASYPACDYTRNIQRKKPGSKSHAGRYSRRD